ncbi:MAG: aryl-sulfate sulfotransferase [Burkholderiales bacterium]|nr:aryl-sulfate sulfotransferase [Burkholderiales bacterium]
MRPARLLARAADGLIGATLLSAALLLAGCGGGGDPPPAIVATVVDDHGPIFRRLQVTLSEPGEVDVEYAAAGGEPLRVASVAQATLHVLVLPRLRERQTYTFRVRARAAPGAAESTAEGGFATGDLPEDVRAIGFAPSGVASAPLLFLSLRSTFTGGLIVDAQGRVVWYARTPNPPLGAARRANGHWVILFGGGSGAGLIEFSALGEVVHRLDAAALPAGQRIHHSVTATPRDTLLFLAFDPREVDGQVRNGEALWEWDPATGALDKRWSAFDFIDPRVESGARSEPQDWLHANSVSIGPRGNVVVSLHFLDQLISLTSDFGAIEWRLGGARSTFAVDPAQASSGQHSAFEVATHRVLMFDNGVARADGSRFSRAIELALDPGSGGVATAWEYRPDPAIWAPVFGSVRRLPNGHSVVAFGAPPGQMGATGPVVLHEVSPSGQWLWSLLLDLPPGGGIFQADPIASVAGEAISTTE